jgi:hypothetical protein
MEDLMVGGGAQNLMMSDNFAPDILWLHFQIGIIVVCIWLFFCVVFLFISMSVHMHVVVHDLCVAFVRSF